jgi:hypothetical protein
MIDAAQDMITDRIGPLLPTVFTDTVNIWAQSLALSHRPVLAVSQVFMNANSQTPILVPSSGYVFDADTGILTRLTPAGGLGRWTGVTKVIYTVGRNPVGQNIRLAAKELAAHLWRNSQLGRARRTRGGPDDESGAGLGYAMPYRVRELLGRQQYWVF